MKFQAECNLDSNNKKEFDHEVPSTSTDETKDHGESTSTGNEKKEKHNKYERDRSHIQKKLIKQLADFTPEKYRNKDPKKATEYNKILKSCVEYLQSGEQDQCKICKEREKEAAEALMSMKNPHKSSD